MKTTDQVIEIYAFKDAVEHLVGIPCEIYCEEQNEEFDLFISEYLKGKMFSVKLSLFDTLLCIDEMKNVFEFVPAKEMFVNQN